MPELLNGNFEGGFRNVDGIGELEVAHNWHPWWDRRSARPEYKNAAPFANRIHRGVGAQQWFSTRKVHTAGIYQRIAGILPGSVLSLAAWVQAWVTGENDPKVSHGRYRMKIGIDPYGGIDAESADIVWSDDGHAVQPYDAYERLHVECFALSDRCTVFIWGQNEWALRHNNAYVDDCTLEISEVPGPGPGGITEERIRDLAREEIQLACETLALLLADYRTRRD